MASNPRWPTRLATALCLAVVAWAAPTTAQTPSVKDRAAAASIMAKGELDAGRFAKAAELYHQAYTIDPSEPGYLFSAARAEDKANDLTAAERDYTAFLKAAPPKHEKYEAAQNYLLEVRSRIAQVLHKQVQEMKAKEEAAKTAAASEPPKPAATVAVPVQPAPPPGVAKPAPQPTDSWKRPVGYAAVGLGVLGIGLGAALISSGSSDGKAAVDAGDVAAGRSANGTVMTGAVALGVGAAVAAVGGWLWWTAPDTTAVAVSPLPGGAQFSIAARF